MRTVKWNSIQSIETQSYRCGYCGDSVASERGLMGGTPVRNPGAFVAICPSCTSPTYLQYTGEQTPAVRIGNDVAGIEEQSILDLYNEARDCTSVGAYTATVLCCRKLLMHIAVDQGATEGESFTHYVDYLSEEGYIPPNGKDWVDHIRQAGNQANHEINIATRDAATDLLGFVEMLLKFIYEFPHRMRSKKADNS